MKKAIIGVLGNVSVDVIASMRKIPGEYEKGEASSLKISGGGSAANTAYWLGVMKERVRMFGCIGSDLFGEIALKSLEGVGVDVEGVRRVKGETGVAIILTVPGKDKRMIRYRGANELLKFSSSEAKGIGILHMASNTYRFLEEAKKGDWRISYDPGPDLPRKEDLNGIWAFLPNEVEARRTFGNKEILEILREIPSEVAVIKGVDGRIWGKSKDETWEAGPLRIKGEMDSTGCGDAFNAGFLKGISCGLSPEDASIFGLACSTLNYTVLGARHPSPKFEKLKEILEENGVWDQKFERLRW